MSIEKLQRNLNQFTIYKLRDEMVQEYFKYPHDEIFEYYNKDGITVSLINFKTEKEVKFNIGWLFNDDDDINAIQIKKVVDSLKSDRITNSLLIYLDGYFLVHFTGRNPIHNEKIYDFSYFHNVARKLENSNVKEQKIVSPVSEITKRNEVLRGRGNYILNEIGDFVSSVTLRLGFTEDHKEESEISSLLTGNIQISKGFKGFFSSKSMKSVKSVINLLKNLVSIFNRDDVQRNIDFLIEEKNQQTLWEIKHILLEKSFEGKWNLGEFDFNDEKIPIDLLRFNKTKIKISIPKSVKEKFDERIQDDLKNFEKEVSSELENLNLLINYDEIFNLIFTEIRERFPTIKIDIAELFYEEKVLLLNGSKRINIFDIFDIWEISDEWNNHFVLSGKIYVNPEDFLSKLSDKLEEIENDSGNIINFESGDYEIPNYYKNLENEEEFNNIAPYLINSNGIYSAVNLDRNLIKSKSGNFEFSDTLAWKRDHINVISTKQGNYASSSNKVFTQSLISINAIKDKIPNLKKIASTDEPKITYTCLIYHGQEDLDTLKNNVKSITFRKGLIEFVTKCRSVGIEPKIYILKKSDDDISNIEIQKAKQYLNSPEYKVNSNKVETILKKF